MKADDFIERQTAALKEVERLTNQLESGEIKESEGMQCIEAVMQALEADAAVDQRQRGGSGTTSRKHWLLGVVVLLVLACSTIVVSR